jgi:IS5 family transposase
MRKIIQVQMKIGEIDISAVKIELNTRDEIPQILRGLQHLYSDFKLRALIFEELWKMVPDDVDPKNGRSGMDLWSILVLGTLRVSCNWDWDKLQEIANNHLTLRQMLGHGIFDLDKRYPRQTLCDNVRWFTPEILERINRIVVNEGHKQIGIGPEDKLHGRCDSFVLETDVHFPTDINLLWDAIRKVLELALQIAESQSVPGWRQARHNLKKAKKLYRRIQKLREQKKEKTSEYKLAVQQYIQLAEGFFERARQCFCTTAFFPTSIMLQLKVMRLMEFVSYGETLSEQLRRRCINGEKIPHEEKLFSLFEPHTEWIVKGKAGISQELGVRVGIVECDSGFVLLSRIMTKETDDKVAVPFIADVKKLYPQLSSCSFDKGFHSPDNQEKLALILDKVILPRKGKLDGIELAIESTEEFKRLRRKHAAVESGLNALENHGLDRCLDSGIEGFARYVGLAVVARNIQLLGRKLQDKLLEKEERYRSAA